MVSPQHKDGNSLGTGASATHDDLALHVLHSLDQPICIVDADDCFVFANKSYTDKYGMGPESVRGVAVRDVIGEAFYDKRIKVLLDRAREEGASEHSGWIDYPEIGRRRVTLDIRRYTYPGLADQNCLIIQCRDITERIELDQRRKKSLEFQEKLMGSVLAMVWIAGSDGSPFFYNDSWLNFTGNTLVEQIREGWVGQIHPDDQQMVRDRMSYAQENREAVHLEFRLRYLTGGYRWVASALDIHDIKARETKLVSDLHESTRLKDQALQQKSAADRANREKSAYLSLASHEIRTPMNPVIGFADLLASNPDLDGDSKEMAQMILKAGKNLLTLIDEVLDFAKIEAGVLQLAPEPLDVHDLLLEAESLYAFDAKSRGIEFKITDNVDSKEELFEDRLRLQQILGTLISNSIKFTHTGEVEVIAETESVRMNGNDLQMLKFVVQDTGVGMDEEEVEKLFKPFARPENEFTDKYAGAGLGLAIAQKLVEAMRGTISVKSELGKGTRVELVIPFTQVPGDLRPALARRETEEIEPEKQASTQASSAGSSGNRGNRAGKASVDAG
jgi:PAS domain S-box-containing protein